MEKLTERLRLREFTRNDVGAVAEFRKDPRYLEFYYRPPYTREECVRFVEKCIAWSGENPRTRFHLAITDRAGEVLFGNCGVRKESIETLRGDVGYELSPAYWGNGYATEAVRAMLDFGFADLELHEIEARCVAANKRSVRLLHRLGFEATERMQPGQCRDEFTDRMLPERRVFLLSRDQWIHSMSGLNA
ncbi:MAG: GNAT family N-acetyltransferase [Gemmatimonadota bacterium]|nr:GNAT family N-acetyltransferase [Gemmatimonadota bacterium]